MNCLVCSKTGCPVIKQMRYFNTNYFVLIEVKNICCWLTICTHTCITAPNRDGNVTLSHGGCRELTNMTYREAMFSFQITQYEDFKHTLDVQEHIHRTFSSAAFSVNNEIITSPTTFDNIGTWTLTIYTIPCKLN